MFRDLEDYNRGFNSFAVALYKSNTVGLVESFMSTHMHIIVQTDSPKDFMSCWRMYYTMYFNRKYCRGTIKNPPPMPKRPDANPAQIPIRISPMKYSIGNMTSLL
jgi:hypothetical protein